MNYAHGAGQWPQTRNLKKIYSVLTINLNFSKFVIVACLQFGEKL